MKTSWTGSTVAAMAAARALVDIGAPALPMLEAREAMALRQTISYSPLVTVCAIV